MKRKFFAVLMAAALCVGMLPSSVLADVEEPSEDSATEEVVTFSETDGQTENDENYENSESFDAEEITSNENFDEAVDETDNEESVSTLQMETEQDQDSIEDDTSPITYTFEGNTVNVNVSLPAGSEVPEDAILTVDSVDGESLGLLETANNVITDGTIEDILFYDISFYTADGSYIPVNDTATVAIEFKQDAFPSEGSTHVIHFDSENENEATDISGVSINQNDIGEITTVNFKTDGFSVFAVADVKPLAEGDADLYINYAHIDLGYSGTAPFDEGSGNTDGNDENATNDIIRSFDRAGYDMTVDIDSASGRSDVYAVRIWFELNIEGSDIENEFYTQGFPWVDHYELEDTDTGHKITGYYDYKDDAGVTASQKSGLSMVVQVLAMTDGATLQPTGEVWLEELNESGEGTGDTSEKVELEFPELEISAKLMMNVFLGQGSEAEASVEGTFNFDTGDTGYLNYGLGNVNGRIFGYGIDLELYDKETGKGMKGQALPSGDTITITVDLNSTYKVDNDTTEGYAGQTLNLGDFADGNYQLLFYALEGNVNSGVTCTDGRSVQSNEGYSPTYPYSRTVCWNQSTASTLGRVAAENGGSWNAKSQTVGTDGTTITIEISSYAITQLMFPYAKTSNSSIYYYYDEGTALEEIQRAAFSAAELWVVQPYDYTDESGNVHELLSDAGKGTFTLNVKDGVVDGTAGIYASASYNSLDGEAVEGKKSIDTQVYNGDDSHSQSAYINPEGNFKNRIKYNDNVTSWNNVQGVEVNDGTSYATLGQDDFYITSGFSWTANSIRNTMAAANALMKFDASALAIDEVRDKLRTPSFTGLSIDAVNSLYGYLPSGGNWESDDQMQAADEDDLIWYSEEQADKTCVAVLYEYRQPAEVPTIIYYFPATKMRVLTDDKISGNVYMTCEVTRLWTVSDVAEEYNEAYGTNITYSDVLADTDGSEYIKNLIPSEDYSDTADLPAASEGYGNAGDYNTPTQGSEYVKVQYDNGSHTGHTGDIQYGDSLLILDYTSRVDISVAQEATDQQSGETVAKSIYNFDDVERVADLVLTGGIDIENGVETESWGDTTTTISVTLPEGATYIMNSAQYGIANSDGTFDITYTQSNPMGQQGTVSEGSGFTQTTSEAEYEAWLANESITEGGMLYISTDDEGNTVLTFSVKGVPIQGTDVVKIYFSVELGDDSDPDKDLPTNSSLSFDATISTTQDNDREKSGNNGNEDNTTILITKTGSNTFSKYAESELTEVNEDLIWKIKWDNTSSEQAAMCEILDDMPDNNEAMGIYQSDYHGTYAISEFQIDLDQIPSADLENLTVYYTTEEIFDGDELVLEHDEQTGATTREISWEEITTEWDKLTINEDGSVDFSDVYEYEYDTEGNITGVANHVYAWAIGGNVPAGEGVHVTLTIHQYGAQGGDYMTNVAYDSTGSSVFHRAATIYRALRTISGTVWLDEDIDGGIDTGVYGNEQKINGVQVHLQVLNESSDWVDATDVFGEAYDVVTELSPNKGYYEFTNLGAGTYRVLFSDDDTEKYEQPYMLSDHVLTGYEVSGIPEAYNSKAKAYESNGIRPFANDDYEGVISDIEMPALSEMSVYDYIYEVPYQNAGYTKPQELDVTKVWVDANGDVVTPDESHSYGTKEITVDVTANTSQSKTWEATLNQGNNWTNKISSLFYYDGNGQPIDYISSGFSVKENGVPSKYELKDTTLTGDADNGYIVTLENDEVTTAISGVKVWDDNDNQDGKRPSSITIKLLADGVEVESQVVTEADNWTWEFTDLPKYDDNDKEIVYTIAEITIDEYSTNITYTYNEESGQYEVEIVNKHEPERTSINVEKLWDDNNDQDGIRPPQITVTLMKNGEKTDQTLTLNEDNKWAGSFTNLDKYTGGKENEYTVVEDIPEGYEADIQEVDDTSTIIITNKHTPETIDISGEKTWNDSDDKDKVRPESITINLYADGEKALDENGNAITATVTASDNWEWSFTELPKYRDGGVEIVYTITENPVDDYLTDITGDADSGFTVVNTLIEPKLSKEVAEDDYERKEDSGEHMHDGEDTSGDGWGTWDDADNNQEVTYHLKVSDIQGVTNLTVHDYLEEGLDFEPNTVEISLSDNGSETALTEGEDYEMTQGTCSDPDCQMEGCTFEVKFNNDLFTDVSSDAYLVITYKALTDTHATDYDDYEDDIFNYSYMTYGTNMLSLRRSAVISTETDMFGFGIYKYADVNGEEVALSGAEFVLERSGMYATFETETDEETGEDYYMVSGWVEDKDSSDTLISDAEGMIRIEGLDDDTYTITEAKAPVGYDIVDETISVVIDEDGNVAVEGDTGSKEVVTGSVINVENTLILIDIEGSKTWDDANNNDGKRPESITIRLLADGEEVDSVTVTAADDWAWCFTDLPQYSAGTEISYTVVEDAVDDYSATYSGNDIINSYTPGKTSLTVIKVWDDSNNVDGIRAASITVELLKNGDKTGQTLVLTADDNWTGSFTELDEYTDGKLNVYSVEEESVEGYYSEVTGDETSGYVITNTHTPEKVEKSNPGTGGTGGSGNPDGSNPSSSGKTKTGDNNMYYLWLTLIVIAAALAVGGITFRTRSARQKRG